MCGVVQTRANIVESENATKWVPTKYLQNIGVDGAEDKLLKPLYDMEGPQTRVAHVMMQQLQAHACWPRIGSDCRIMLQEIQRSALSFQSLHLAKQVEHW